MSGESSVFISWSGEESQQVAEALRTWLPLVIESPRFWISSRDLPEGKRWAIELAQKLEKCNFGVIVLTPSNLEAPWLLFEAGCLAKNIESGRVIPFLVGVEKHAIPGPLASFQAIHADRTGTERLVESIRMSLATPPEKTIIDARFRAFWPELEQRIFNVKNALKTPQQKGINLPNKESESRISFLAEQLADNNRLIRQLVEYLNPIAKSKKSSKVIDEDELKWFEGAWIVEENRTQAYAHIIKGKLVVPYCYGGNTVLTSVYYDWKKVGDYWFARYRWFDKDIRGFAFYRKTSKNRLEGSWWPESSMPSELTSFESLNEVIRQNGVRSTWRRLSRMTFPSWAQAYLDAVANGTEQPKG